MPETATATTTAEGNGSGPTPLAMPGAQAATTAPANGDGADGAEDGDAGEELSYEELLAERDKWRNQSKRNEGRAKSNAEKAKLLDSEGQQWKAAWEREQAAANAAKTPEQIRAEAEAQANTRIAEANEARAEAEAQVLRLSLAAGKLPAFAMPLITARTEDEITEQITSVTASLAEYVAAQLDESGPRRPAPNPLAGLGGSQGTSPKDQFRSAMQKIPGFG